MASYRKFVTCNHLMPTMSSAFFGSGVGLNTCEPVLVGEIPTT